MEKKANPTREYFKLIAFVVGWVELFLLMVAVLLGRHMGFRLTIAVCFWIGATILIVFASILVINLSIICVQKLFKGIIKKHE
jgi:hypothetical protein